MGRFVVDLTTRKTEKVVVDLKHKVPNTKVPFYYDDKIFSVSPSSALINESKRETGRVTFLL